MVLCHCCLVPASVIRRCFFDARALFHCTVALRSGDSPLATNYFNDNTLTPCRSTHLKLLQNKHTILSPESIMIASTGNKHGSVAAATTAAALPPMAAGGMTLTRPPQALEASAVEGSQAAPSIMQLPVAAVMIRAATESLRKYGHRVRNHAPPPKPWTTTPHRGLG